MWRAIEEAKVVTKPAVIAVIDSGLLPDTGVDEFPLNSYAFIDMLEPGNTRAKDWDTNSHGTHVAGIIGAANNGEGTNGLNSAVRGQDHLSLVYRTGIGGGWLWGPAIQASLVDTVSYTHLTLPTKRIV